MKKQIPKVIIKAPEKLPSKVVAKKYAPEADGFDSILQDAKEHTEQIKKIRMVVRN